jgi:hypothetical protein
MWLIPGYGELTLAGHFVLGRGQGLPPLSPHPFLR